MECVETPLGGLRGGLPLANEQTAAQFVVDRRHPPSTGAPARETWRSVDPVSPHDPVARGHHLPALPSSREVAGSSCVPAVSARLSFVSAEFEEIVEGDTVWRFERSFLTSTWTCVFGRGCKGILPEPAEHLGLGCCSIGADLGDEDEARMISALGATLPPERFEHHADAADGGVFSDATRLHTRVVDGACIFLNRPGFAGGAGCALHLEALAQRESPVDWKPSVCWQLPIKVDWQLQGDGTEVATVRRGTRRDSGAEGTEIERGCPGGPEAFVGDRRVIDSMGDELDALVGAEVHVELRRRFNAP